MKIRINKKKYEVKETNLLTVSEYLHFMSIEKFTFLDYISHFTGFTVDELKKAKINQMSLNTIIQVIGQLPSINQFLEIKRLPDIITIGGKDYNYDRINDLCGSVGARILLTQKEPKLKPFENIVYLVAILIDGSLDFEKTDRTFEELREYNYLDVFTIGCFFLRKFQTQLRKELPFFKRLKMRLMTKILVTGKWQA